MSQQCPGGSVNEERLRSIYVQFFPQGSTCEADDRPRRRTVLAVVDAVKYARHLFAIIDRNHKGACTFDVSSARRLTIEGWIWMYRITS